MPRRPRQIGSLRPSLAIHRPHRGCGAPSPVSDSACGEVRFVWTAGYRPAAARPPVQIRWNGPLGSHEHLLPPTKARFFPSNAWSTADCRAANAGPPLFKSANRWASVHWGMLYRRKKSGSPSDERLESMPHSCSPPRSIHFPPYASFAEWPGGVDPSPFLFASVNHHPESKGLKKLTKLRHRRALLDPMSDGHDEIGAFDSKACFKASQILQLALHGVSAVDSTGRHLVV